MTVNCILDERKAKQFLSQLTLPPGFCIYPFFLKNVQDCICIIDVNESCNVLNIEFFCNQSRTCKSIEIKDCKRIYILIPHGTKILKKGGETFMEKTSPEDLTGPGSTRCKKFETDKCSIQEIFICHIRSNMDLDELKEFLNSKSGKAEIKKECLEGATENEITLVIADTDKENYEVYKITEGIFLIFPDYTGNYKEKLKEIVNGVKKVKIISHGRKNIKEMLEELGIAVKFYDITSTLEDLYKKYKSLEKEYKNKDTFLNLLNEIEESFQKQISEPLILKKVVHRLAKQLANLRITKELFLMGKETEGDLIKTLEHIKDVVASIKSEMEKSGNVPQEIIDKLSNIEEKLLFDWEKLIDEIEDDLRTVVEDIKKLIIDKEGGENEDSNNW